MISDKVKAFFGAASPLKQAAREDGKFNYEERPQQEQMAVAIAEAMDGEENLCVEAPTGVGKTFAYLVPAVLRAMELGRAVIISTHTINLQEQIITRDIPLLKKLLKCDFDETVAKGKSNYLCLRRMNNIIDLDQELLAMDGVAGELTRLHRWANSTKTGDYAEIPHGISSTLWRSVCCERGNCLNARCEFYKRCHLQRARRRIQDAKIIVTNHAFLFTAIALDEEAQKQHKEQESLLPPHSAIIIDEGHTIEDCASDHLGCLADSIKIRSILAKLYNKNSNKGLLTESEAYSGARALVLECSKSAELFFERLIEWLEPQQSNPLRYTVPNHIQNYLAAPIQKLVESLKYALENDANSKQAPEIKAMTAELELQNAALDTFFTMSEPNYVYWFEYSTRKDLNVSFHSVPIDISSKLQELLFQRKPVIVTSATLAINNDISYFQQRTGCQNARTLILDTPFDYQRQVSLHIVTNMPDPRDGNYASAAALQIQNYLQLTNGRAFVLFTSYKTMNDVADRMQKFFQREGMNFLMQGEKLSPRKMLESFRSTPNSVIFGTSSFWTGVDVPGDALSNVIITRLPFQVPDHPLIKARSEKLESLGRRPFFEYSVPEAVLKFRQGFGRLIRTRDDTGIVVILDSRISTKSYGKTFLASIPRCPVFIQ